MTKQKMKERNMLGHIMNIVSEMENKPLQYKKPYSIREFVYDAWNWFNGKKIKNDSNDKGGKHE